jgi:hypothetical protein
VLADGLDQHQPVPVHPVCVLADHRTDAAATPRGHFHTYQTTSSVSATSMTPKKMKNAHDPYAVRTMMIV